MNELNQWTRPQWCEHCNRDVTYFGHAPDCPEYDSVALIPVEQRIAEAVAAEREACAAIADDILAKMNGWHPTQDWAQQYMRGRKEVAMACAAAIRARAGGEEAPMPPELPQG